MEISQTVAVFQPVRPKLLHLEQRLQKSSQSSFVDLLFDGNVAVLYWQLQA